MKKSSGEKSGGNVAANNSAASSERQGGAGAEAAAPSPEALRWASAKLAAMALLHAVALVRCHVCCLHVLFKRALHVSASLISLRHEPPRARGRQAEWGRAASWARFVASVGVVSASSNAFAALASAAFAAEAAAAAPGSVGELLGFATSLDTVRNVQRWLLRSFRFQAC
jgi:hypothetical protein